MTQKLIVVAASFARNVERRAGGQRCWPWRGGRNERGYGITTVRIDGRPRAVGAHQVAHYVETGVWERKAEGRLVRHLCHNPACCNPAHLKGGTYFQNSCDRLARRLNWPLRNVAGELIWPFDLPVHNRPALYPEPVA